MFNIACGSDQSENLDPAAQKTLQEMLGPQAVDNAVRQAISICWMALPRDKKSVDDLEREIRRLMERALKDLKEDARVFWNQ